MSAHLMIVAGYMDLPLSHKLALVKMCDSADDQTRLAYPGLDAVRLWTGAKKSRALEVIKELQEWGLLMQVEAGHRGRRAVFKVFPNSGDEAFSLAHKQGRPCPGADRFNGSPGIPNEAQIDERIAAMDRTNDRVSRSAVSRERVRSDGPNQKGSDLTDPIEGNGSDSDARKGPISTPNGSDLPDPFGTTLREVPTSPSSSEVADATSDAALPRLDVERLCAHLADRIVANGSRRPAITKKWRDAARLLMDRDGRSEDQVHRAIDWCQDDEFWRANVQSMPTLREKYDTLRLQAQRPAVQPARRYDDGEWDRDEHVTVDPAIFRPPSAAREGNG